MKRPTITLVDAISDDEYALRCEVELIQSVEGPSAVARCGVVVMLDNIDHAERDHVVVDDEGEPLSCAVVLEHLDDRDAGRWEPEPYDALADGDLHFDALTGVWS